MRRSLLLAGLTLCTLGALDDVARARDRLPRFQPLPPVWKVVDEPVAAAPKARKSNVIGNSFMTLFSRRVDRGLGVSDQTPARDVNSLDEVPDSAWFENRAGRRPLGAEDVFWGPGSPDGSSCPAAGEPLIVSGAKLIGANPGFFIKDSKGGRYLVKFDPIGKPELQTSTDVIGNRLFWALGYHVPYDCVFVFRREQLSIKPGLEILDLKTEKKRQMVDADLDPVFARVNRSPDGSYLCQLSRFLSGQVLGGYPQEGVRKDDPNDKIPHEDRRSLRGLYVFGGWVKHTDLKEDNTLDSYVTEGEKSFVRHYLVDFGEIFSGQAGENGEYRDGFEYSFDPGAIFTSFVTLGLYVKPWERVKDTGIRGVGPFVAEPFEFYRWKTLLPNQFMRRMNDLDAFWGVRKLYALSDEHLAAAIRAGAFSDPAASAYLLETLKKRRERIAREVLPRVNPAHDFTLLDGGAALGFQDFAVQHGLAEAAQTSWRVQLAVLGKDADRFEPPTELREPKVPLQAPAAGEQLVVRIQTLRSGRPVGQATHVHLMGGLGTPGLRIIGIDRWRNGRL